MNELNTYERHLQNLTYFDTREKAVEYVKSLDIEWCVVLKHDTHNCQVCTNEDTEEPWDYIPDEPPPIEEFLYTQYSILMPTEINIVDKVNFGETFIVPGIHYDVCCTAHTNMVGEKVAGKQN